MGEVPDGINDVAHAPAGGAAAPPGQPRRGRQQRLAHRPLGLGHIRGIAAGPDPGGDSARAAPARHHAGGWVDITIGSRVERHARLLASRRLRDPAITRSLLVHLSDTPRSAQEDPDPRIQHEQDPGQDLAAILPACAPGDQPAGGRQAAADRSGPTARPRPTTVAAAPSSRQDSIIT